MYTVHANGRYGPADGTKYKRGIFHLARDVAVKVGGGGRGRGSGQGTSQSLRGFEDRRSGGEVRCELREYMASRY